MVNTGPSAMGWSKAGPFVPALGIVALQVVAFPMDRGSYALAVVSGLLTALVALGLALVHRSNRIVNFSQGDLGTLPTVLTVGLVAATGLPWLLAVTVGLAASLLLGAVVELAIIRRFWRAPRLLLTVATIGISQLLVVCAVLLPRWWGERTFVDRRIPQPFQATLEVGEQTFRAAEILTLIVAPLLLAALAVVLRRTDLGIAVRAAAERADRAALLGVPVKRLQTLVWATAGVLSFVGVFLHASIFGVGGAGSLSIQAMLFALGAFVVGRLDHLPAVAVSALALRILGQGVVAAEPSRPGLVYVVLAAVILVVLVLRRNVGGRSDSEATATWQDAGATRPIPAELRDLVPVRAMRFGGPALLVAVAAGLPFLLSPSDTLRLSTVAVFALIALSITVLTGWAGQVSLGQMSFVATGGAVGAVATDTWGFDLTLALPVAGLAGAAVAIAVGLPALRPPGLLGHMRLPGASAAEVVAALVLGGLAGGLVTTTSGGAAGLGAGAAMAALVLVVTGTIVGRPGRAAAGSGVLDRSLGQLLFIVVSGVAGAVAFAAGAAPTNAILIAAGAGAATAFVVGLPVDRFPGLYLAVTTLAFALAAQNHLLNRRSQSWIPPDRIGRPDLLRRFDLGDQRSMYLFVLAVVFLGFIAVAGLKRSRTGRVLQAVRDNDQAAAGLGISPGRVKLLGFALSGFLAAVAGCLLVHVNQQYSETPFVAQESLTVFTAAVVGGLGSWLGPILGAVYLKGGEFFLPDSWRLLPTALGVLGVLLVLPGGLADLIRRMRDAILRRIAERRGIVVPSLVADRADPNDVAPALRAPAFDLPDPAEVGAPDGGDR